MRRATLAALWRSALLVCAAAPALLHAAAATEFARVDNDASGRARALQVAIVSYVTDRDDLQVDLIGAVHIGDGAYYENLNRLFRDYDALLYEMVVPDDADDTRDYSHDLSFISTTQIGMKDALGLEFQLDRVDYRLDNFVHADLTSSMLAQSMADRQESLYVYFWRLFFASLDEYARDPLGLEDIRLLTSLLSGEREDALKIAMARELVNTTKYADIFGGEGGSAVIAARNEHAVEVLREQLALGARRIGIFYGVAHMSDFEQRLADELGLEPRATRWIDAWTFAPPRCRDAADCDH